MKCALLAAATFFALLPATSALTQSQSSGDPVPEVEQDVERGEDPVIIDRSRGPERGRERETIRPEHEAFVQIEGAWATDEAACAATEGNGDSGLYLTDTLIRWEGGTCNIRDVDAQEQSAVIRAYCTAEGQRREQVFQLEVTGESTATLDFTAEGAQQEVELTRCPTSQ